MNFSTGGKRANIAPALTPRKEKAQPANGAGWASRDSMGLAILKPPPAAAALVCARLQ
jgi:hypothetical protein